MSEGGVAVEGVDEFAPRGANALRIVGFVTLGAELLLARTASLVIGADGGGLPWTIGAFLCGNAIGAIAAGRGVGNVRSWSVAALCLYPLGAIFLGLLPELLHELDATRSTVRVLGSLAVLAPAIPFGALPVVWYGIGKPDADETRGRIGRWIAAVDLGSALGALALPLVLLPVLGAQVSTFALTLLLALVTWIAWRVPVPEPRVRRADRSQGNRAPRSMIALAALVGAGTLTGQLVVTRILGEVLGTSLLVLGTATAATLVGSAISARLAPGAVLRFGASSTVLLAGTLWWVTQGAAAWGLARVPEVFVSTLGAIDPTAPTWLPTLVKLAVVAAVVLPPSFAAGAVLPTLLAAGCRDALTLRRRAGLLEAAWLLGGAGGAWLGALLFLSAYGSGATLAFVAASTAGVVVIGVFRGTGLLRPAFVAVMGGLAIGGGFFAGAHASWDDALLGVGVYAWDRGDLARGEALAGWRDREVTYIGEGRIAKVTIESSPATNTNYLRVGGRIEGSVAIDPRRPSNAALPTEVMLGLLPSVEGSGKGQLLAIGLGGGTTVSTAARSWDGPVTALELEPEVARALASEAGRVAFPREHETLFPPEGPDAPAAPTLVFEDARSYLTRVSTRWDAIVCQPSEPWLPWSAPLFTEEFYRLVSGRLAPGGVAVHWLQLYKIAPAEFAAIALGFLEVFPDARLYHPPATGEVILVGGGPTPAPDPAENPIVGEEWRQIGRGPFPAPLLDADTLRAWCSVEASAGGDLRARLEFRLPLLGDRGENRAGEILQGLRRAAGSGG